MMGGDGDVERLTKWMKANGVRVEEFPFAIAEFGDAGRGCVASRDVEVFLSSISCLPHHIYLVEHEGR